MAPAYTSRPSLAVIVPVYDEAANIQPFYARAKAALDAISSRDVESWRIVFVNNGSTDQSLAEILALRDQDARVQVLTLSKNFGYHAALIAGLSMVEAERYALIDVDCEDPPELLTLMHRYVVQGAALVYGIRSKRDEPKWLTACRRLFYRLLKGIADSDVVMWMGEFSVMTKAVRDAILAPKTTFPFLRAEMGYAGFIRVGVPYQRAKRVHGRSHYNVFRLLKFAVGGLLSSTTFPLRLVTYVAGLLALGYAGVLLTQPFDAAVTLAPVFGFVLQLLALPVLALYLARTYRNGIGRPVYVVDWSRTVLTAGDVGAMDAWERHTA